MKKYIILIFLLLSALDLKAENTCSEFLLKSSKIFMFEDGSRKITVKGTVSDLMVANQMNDPKSRIGSYERLYLQMASQIKGFVGRKDVTRVFYPAVGSDGTLGFKIYPGAKVVIGLDNHPFHLSESDVIKLDLESLNKQNLGWEYGNQVGLQNTVSLSFFNKLFFRFPRAKIVSVNVAKNPLKQGVSGVVEFYPETNSEIHRYIHIYADNQDGISSRSWVQSILENGVDLTIAKGSMNIFRPDTADFNNIGRIILESLIQNKGILIDGDFVFLNNFEYFNTFDTSYRFLSIPSVADILARLFDDNIKQSHGGYSFGYSSKTNIIIF